MPRCCLLYTSFLRMGIKGKNVLDMSSDLIQSAGSLDALAHMEAAEIADICKGCLLYTSRCV